MNDVYHTYASREQAAAAAAAVAPVPPSLDRQESTETVQVQMVVPLDAQVGGLLQASVMRGGKEHHFSVVVPEGAVPGETVLTVPVPIPLDQSPAAAPPAPAAPAPPASLPAASGGGERGIDAAAGYLMDRGVDFGEAIEAAPKLVARGLDSAALIRDADPGALQQASSLSDAAVLAALSHRPAAEVQASLSAMRGGVPVRGQRRASYSIDDLEDDEPLARRQGPY